MPAQATRIVYGELRRINTLYERIRNKDIRRNRQEEDKMEWDNAA